MPRTPSLLANELLDAMDLVDDPAEMTVEQTELMEAFLGWVNERRLRLEERTSDPREFEDLLNQRLSLIADLRLDEEFRDGRLAPDSPPGDIYVEQIVLRVIQFETWVKNGVQNFWTRMYGSSPLAEHRV